LSTTVLLGSVATRVNRGKIFNDLFIANLLLSVMVKEFWKSVTICQSYGKKLSGTFFSGHNVYTTRTFGILVSSCHIRRETAGHENNDAQLIVELVDHFVAVEHVRRSLNVRVVLWSLDIIPFTTHNSFSLSFTNEIKWSHETLALLHIK